MGREASGEQDDNPGEGPLLLVAVITTASRVTQRALMRVLLGPDLIAGMVELVFVMAKPATGSGEAAVGGVEEMVLMALRIGDSCLIKSKNDGGIWSS